MTRRSVVRVVFTDTNIIINLSHVGRLDVLACLDGHEFIVPAQVVAEVTDPEQRALVERAIEHNLFEVEDSTDIREQELMAELSQVMGAGEAACLAMAAERNALIATSDRKRAFMREVRRLLGEGRVINLAGLFVLAIRAGAMTWEQADEYKEQLARRRYTMNVPSFRGLVTKE